MPDFGIGNVVGESYCFTALCPIRSEAVNSPCSFHSRIREYLSDLENGPDSPFAKLSSIHLCRLVVVEDLPFEGVPAKLEHLNSSYLLFSANISGDLTACLADFAATLPEVIHNIWVNCVGYPGVEFPDEFIGYLKKCQIKTSFFFGAYPQASLQEVLKALETQKEFTQFLIESQSLPDGALKERFSQFMSELRKNPVPRPGTL